MSPGTRLSSCLSPGQTPLPASPPRPFLLSVRPPPDLARCADPEAASSAPMSPSRSPSVESPPAGCEWALRDSSRRAPLAFGALASDPDPGLRRQEQGEATSSRLNAASNGEELLHEPARREDIPSESNAAPQGYPQGLLHEPAAHRKQGEATSSRLNAASKGEESLNTIPSESNAAQRRPLHAPAVNRKREDGANELSSASEGRELLHEPAESRRQREAAPKELNAAPQGHGSELNAASRRGRESHRQECSWSSHEPNASEQRDGASSNELYTLSGEPDDDSARAHGSADNPEKDGKQGEASWLDVELSSDHEHGTRDQGPPREAAAPSEAGQGRRRAVVSESTLRGAGNSGSREQRAAAAPSSSRIDRRQPQEEEPAAQSGSSGSRESRATAAPSNSRSDQRRWQDEEPVAQVRGQRRASNGSSGSHEPGATAAPNNSRIDRRRWQDEEPVAQVRGQRRASNGSSGSHEPRATAAPNNSRIDRRRWQDEEPVAQVRGQRRASNGSIGSHEPRATAAPSNSRTDRRRWQKEEPAAQPRGKRKLSSDSSHQPASNWSHPCNGGEPAEPREFGAEGPAASLASRRPANPPRLARRGSSWSVPEIVPRGHTSAPLLRLHRTKTADSHRKLVTLADCPAGRSVSVGASSLAFRRKPPPPCADRGRALLLPAAQRRVQKAKDGQAGGPRGVAGTRFAPFQARADAPARLRSCSQPPSSASSAVPGQHPSRSVSQPPSSASSAVPGQHPPSSASCAVPGQHPSRSVSQPSAPQRPPAAASSCEGCPAEARTQPAHAAFRPTRSVSQPPAPQPQSVAASSCEGCPAEARTQPPRALALRLTRSLSQPQKASGQPVLRPIPSSARCRPDADDGRSAEWTAKGALGSHLCPRPDSERPPSFLPSRDGESVLGSPSPGCALRRRSYSQGSCDLSQSGRLVLPPSRAACSRSASGASSSIFEHSLPEHAQTGGQFYRLASLSGAVSVSPPCPPPRTDASVPEGLSRPDEAEVEQNPSPSSSPVAGRLASVSGPSEASLFPPPCAETRPDAVEVEQGSSPSSCHPDRLASVSGVSSLCPPPCAETSVSTSFEVLGRLSRPDAVGVEQDSSPSSCHLDRLASVPGPSLCPPPCTETSATHSFGVCGRFSRPGTVEAEQDSSSSSCPSGALPSAGQLCRPVGLPASQVPPAPGTIDRGNRPCEAAGEHVPFPFCETAPAAACSPPSLACLRMPLVAFQAAALNAPAGSGHPCRKRGKPSAADVSSALPSAEPARPPLKFSAAVWRASVPEDQRPGENAAGVAELPRPVRELSATRVVKTAHIELEEAAEAHTLPCGVLDAPAPEQPGTSEAHTSPSGEPDAPAPEQSGKQPRGFSATSQRARVVKTAHIEKEEISEAHTLPCGVLDAPTPEQSGKQPKRFSATSRVVKTAHIEKEETSEARTLPPGELEAPAPGRPGRLLKFSATRCPPRAAEPVRGGKENPSERLDAAPPSELPEKPCGQLRFPAPGHDAGQAAELPPSERCAGEAVGAPCEAAPAGADAGHRVSHDVTRLASRAAPRPRPVLSGGKKGDDPNAEPATFASTVCDVDAALEAEREGSLGVNCAKATAPSPTMSMAQPSQRLDPPVGAVGWFQLDAAAAAFSPAPAPPRLADRQARRVGPPSPRLHAVVENIAQFLSAVSAAPPDPTRCCAAPGGEPAPGPASVGEGSACSISPSASVLSERTSSCAREGVVSAASLAGEATPPLSRVHPAAEHAAASSGVSFEPASCVSEGPSPGVAPAAPAARTAGSAASGGAPPSPRQRAAASRALSSSAASAGVVEGNAGAEAPSPTPSETSRSESPDIAWLPESTTTSYRAAPGTRAAEGPGTYASTNTEAASPTPPPEASSSESPVIAWLPECTTTSYRAAPSTSVVEGPGTYANTSAEAPSSTPPPEASSESSVIPECTATSYRAAPGTRVVEAPETYASTSTEAPSPTPPEASLASREAPATAWLPECATASYRAVPSTRGVDGPEAYAITSNEAPSPTSPEASCTGRGAAAAARLPDPPIALSTSTLDAGAPQTNIPEPPSVSDEKPGPGAHSTASSAPRPGKDSGLGIVPPQPAAVGSPGVGAGLANDGAHAPVPEGGANPKVEGSAGQRSDHETADGAGGDVPAMLRRIRALEGDRDLLLRVAERCRDDVLAAQAVLHRTAASLDLPSLFRGSAGMGGPLPAGLAPGCCLSAVPAPVDGRLAQDEGSAGGATRSHISSAPGGTEEGAVRRGLPGPGVEVGVPLSALHLLGEEPRGGNGSAVLCSARPTTARTGGGEAGRRVSGRNLEMYQDGWLSTVPGSALRPELGPIGSGHLEGSTEGGVDRHPSGLNPALCAGQGDRPQAGVLPETKGGREGEGPQHPLDSAGQPQPKARPGASRGPVAPLRRAVPLVLQAAGPPWCGGVAVVPVAGLQSPPVGVQFACDDARGNVGSSPPWVPAHGAAAASPPARIPLEFAAGGQEEKPAAAPQKQQQQASACSTRTGIGGRADKLPPPRLTGRRALRALDGNSAAAFGVAPRKRQVSAQQVGVSRLQCRGAVVNTNSNSNSGNNSNNNNNNNNNNNECIVVAAGGKRAGANPLRTASARLRAVRRKSSKLP